MTVVSEYPDTVWMGYPKSFGTGRDGQVVKLSVVHYTAGASGPGAARNGAAYDKRRTDGTSCHVFHDSEESVQEVWTRDRSNSAFSYGNRLGIHHELCATNVPRSWWLSGVGLKTLLRAAKASAWDCRTYNLLPRRLSVAEVKRTWNNKGPGGLCGHADITQAFGLGDHMDPGPGFPWNYYESQVQTFLGTGVVKVGEDVADWRVVNFHWDGVNDNDGSDTAYGWTNGDKFRVIPNGVILETCRRLSAKPEYNVNSPEEAFVLCGRQEINHA